MSPWALAAVAARKPRLLLYVVLGSATAVIGAIVIVVVIVASAVAAIFSACQEQAEGVTQPAPSAPASQEARSDIPDEFLGLYQEAAEKYGIDWAVLAAVGKQESNHGQDYSGCATSEDGARGPMQFIPSTWSSQGVDGNGDGEKDPCNEEDAIHSGASYLAELGAAEDPRGALCSYYGACGDANADYADEVMAQAEAYRGSEEDGGSTSGDSGGSSGGESTSGGSGTGLIPPLMSKAYAAGVSDTPAGWSLVEPDKTMTYYSESRFDSYIEAAVEEWNSFGGVDIQPADSAEEANLVFKDVSDSEWQYGWAWGYTRTTDPAATKGEIVIKESAAASGSETNRKSLMVHEMGHALGFEHKNSSESVMNQNLQTDVPTEMDVRIYKETWGGEGSPVGADPASSYGEEQTSEECRSFGPLATLSNLWPGAA